MLHDWLTVYLSVYPQLCLSGLSEGSRQVANGELLGVSLLLEEVLSSGQAVNPLQLETTALSSDRVQKNISQVNSYFCRSTKGPVFIMLCYTQSGLVLYFRHIILIQIRLCTSKM